MSLCFSSRRRVRPSGNEFDLCAPSSRHPWRGETPVLDGLHYLHGLHLHPRHCMALESQTKRHPVGGSCGATPSPSQAVCPLNPTPTAVPRLRALQAFPPRIHPSRPAETCPLTDTRERAFPDTRLSNPHPPTHSFTLFPSCERGEVALSVRWTPRLCPAPSSPASLGTFFTDQLASLAASPPPL